jgi:hypothetical protein
MFKLTFFIAVCFSTLFLASGCDQKNEKIPQIHTQSKSILETSFTTNVTSTHYIIIESSEEKYLEDREKISNFCRQENEKKLGVSSFFLKGQGKKPYFSVRRFDNMDEGLLFLRAIRNSRIIDSNMGISLLSQENYRRVIGRGFSALEKYNKFYKEEFQTEE